MMHRPASVTAIAARALLTLLVWTCLAFSPIEADVDLPEWGNVQSDGLNSVSGKLAPSRSRSSVTESGDRLVGWHKKPRGSVDDPSPGTLLPCPASAGCQLDALQVAVPIVHFGAVTRTPLGARAPPSA
jgi:hypothetical protein